MTAADDRELTRSATLPDESLRLEEYCLPHERAAPSYSLRLARAAGGETFFYVGDARWTGDVAFGDTSVRDFRSRPGRGGTPGVPLARGVGANSNHSDL